MDIYDTITKPWREPIGYLELALYFVIFLIVAGVIYDTLRVVATFAAHAVAD